MINAVLFTIIALLAVLLVRANRRIAEVGSIVVKMDEELERAFNGVAADIASVDMRAALMTHALANDVHYVGEHFDARVKVLEAQLAPPETPADDEPAQTEEVDLDVIPFPALAPQPAL